MKRLLIAAAIVAAGSVIANDDPFLKGDALQAEIAKSCADGCVTFSRQEAEAFQVQLDKLLVKKQKEAFEAGARWQAQACASLVSR